MGVHRVLDGELVQLELAGYVGELLMGRPVEADPGNPVAIATGRRHLCEILRVGDPLAVVIDGTPNDHAGNPTGASNPSGLRWPPAR